MFRDGFLRFCDDPDLACCRAEKELEQLRTENVRLQAVLAGLQELAKAKAEGRISPVKCPCDASEEAQELMNAKADGRMVELPCKIGDIVYADCCGDIIGWEVYQIEMRSDAPDKYYACGDDDGYAADEMYFEKSDIGKTVFFSHEAAKKALEVGE